MMVGREMGVRKICHPPHRCKVLAQTLAQWRFPCAALHEFRGGDRRIGSLECAQQFFLRICKHERLFPARVVAT